MIHGDTEKLEHSVNNRFAQVSVSRAEYDAQIYTNDESDLDRYLSRHLSRPQRLKPGSSAGNTQERTCLRATRDSGKWERVGRRFRYGAWLVQMTKGVRPDFSCRLYVGFCR